MRKPFSTLGRREQVRRLSSLAQTALDAYPLGETRLRLLAHWWNTTFCVTAHDGSRYMLRVHHPKRSAPAIVRSELEWLAALSGSGMRVPEPVATREQTLLTTATHPGVPEPRICVLFRWIEGRFLNEGLTPAHLFQVGHLMAQLHRQAAAWVPPPGFVRGRVDNLDGMERDQNDDFNPRIAEEAVRTVGMVVDPAAAAIVETSIGRVWETLRALGTAPDQFGLIHADLHQGNYLFRDGVAGAIDFDDCGHGHWLYDIAIPLSQLRRHPRYAELRSALLAGYADVRSLPGDHEALLESFLALRGLQDLLGIFAEREQPTFRSTWQTYVASELELLRAFAARNRLTPT